MSAHYILSMQSRMVHFLQLCPNYQGTAPMSRVKDLKIPRFENKNFRGAIYDKQYGMDNTVKEGATIARDSTTVKFCDQNGLFLRIKLRSYCKTLFIMSLPENRKIPVKYPS